MLKEKYTPMYFLSSLGAGGLSISFFMYLTFLIPHQGYPMATFDHVFGALLNGNLLSFVTAFSLVFVLGLAFYHFKFLFWNIKQYKAFKETEAYKTLRTTNAEVTLMAMPLTFAMTINVSFVLGAVFIPGLWSIVEYLFPLALIAMATAGYYSLKIFGEYALRVFTTGGFSFDVNNNLSQLVAVFAFTMVAVSFAAPGAMSHNLTINTIGIGFSIFFISLSILLLIPKLLFGIQSMIDKGIGIEASPSMWILIPILTLLGIAILRIDMGILHHFEYDISKISKELTQTSLFVLTTVILSLQLIFGAIGYAVMKKLNYFEEFIQGEKKSPVSFALVCPGVAFMVFGMFFINFGLEYNGILEKYSLIYFLLMLPFIFVQYKTIKLFFQLKSKFSL